MMGVPIRVVVANQPRLIRELVLETISQHPDIEIVAEIPNEGEIIQVVDGTHPDFLIIELDGSGERPAICDILLRRHPDLKVLALDPKRNISILFWALIEMHSSPVEASEAGLISTLRRKGEYVA